MPVDIFAKAPSQRTMVVHTRLGDSVRVFDGRAGWIASPDRPVGLLPLTGGNLEGAKLDAMLSFPAQIKQAFSQWQDYGDGHRRPRGPGAPGDQSQAASGQLLLRRRAGLLVRVLRFVDTAVGRVPTQIDYSDYRDVSGVKMPFKWTTTWTNGQATTS